MEERGKLDSGVAVLEALEVIQNNGPFAVIVSDLNMAPMNGIDFLKLQSESPRGRDSGWRAKKPSASSRIFSKIN